MSQPTAIVEHDLLLFSDIHLGSDLKRGTLRAAGSIEALRGSDADDKVLAEFMDEYAEQRTTDGPVRPWRLVLDGDVVDFIGISVTPKDLGARTTFDATANEEEYGLEPGADRCMWMMRQVLRRHPLFFRHLAKFIGHGNDLVVVRGNHDAAFFFPEVQRVFIEGLVEAGREIGLLPEELEHVGRSVQFEDWFYLEPGRIYVEHGNAHDEYCADPGVSPTEIGRPDILSQPASTLSVRYFCNRFPSLDLDTVDQWSAGEFLKWAFFTENPFKVGLAFVQTVSMLMLPFVRRAMRRFRRAQAATANQDTEAITGEFEIAERVTSRVTRMARGVKVSVQGAEKFAVGVAKLVRKTARLTATDVAQMFYLDRMATLGGGVAVSAMCVALNAPWTVRAGIAATFLVSAMLLDRHLQALRRVAIGPKLRSAADELAKLMEVPLIVMGHSHKAVDVVLPDGHTRYVNLGTWMGAAVRAKSGVGLPHLVIRGNDAAFLRWQPRG